jgi:ribosomal protein S18 acetylase RimI-like enzyme
VNREDGASAPAPTEDWAGRQDVVVLREFTLADYDAVLCLWQGAGPGVEIRPSDSRDQVAKKLARDPDLFLVAEIADDGGHQARRRAGLPAIVGVIMGAWDGRRGWLHHLTVAPAYRHRGIATALILEVERRLRAKGCLKINLLVRANNAEARRLYRRLGYEDMPTIVAMGKEL